MTQYFMEMKNISKRFFGTVALENVNFKLRHGDIHALVGENGAGKSTLVKILCGVYQKDSGQIFFNGMPVEINCSRDAQNLGVGAVFQEINLVPRLTVAENIFLNREEINHYDMLDRKKMSRKTQDLMDKLRFNVRSDTLAVDLSVAQGYLVEIARAIFCDAKLIIMDEPTAALSNQEVEILFQICRQLKAEGRSIIYISHRLIEITQIADRVTIMRDGKMVTTIEKEQYDLDAIIQHMIGRSLEKGKYPERCSPIGKELLSVKHLNSMNYLKDISFAIKEGEILGIAGLTGAGRSLLLHAIYGAVPKTTGTIKLRGRDLSHRWPPAGIIERFGLLTEDRKTQSLVIEHTVESNIQLGSLKRISQWGFIKQKYGELLVEDAIKKYEIYPPEKTYICNFLSGGNQQKVVVARALFKEPAVLLLDEPTKGIDVGSKWEIYKLIRKDFSAHGIGIILVSSELPELIGLSDRIMVLYKGRKTLELSSEEFSQEKILRAASGLL